ncbi:hypothetical protein VNO80_17557 [Phaseolus coccineus]|uniref:Uncharacterized protein n=1 Tax=Phaseolus coccineus TaxID=3886 RepID=A0AAN9MCK9_PHACN
MQKHPRWQPRCWRRVTLNHRRQRHSWQQQKSVTIATNTDTDVDDHDNGTEHRLPSTTKTRFCAQRCLFSMEGYVTKLTLHRQLALSHELTKARRDVGLVPSLKKP